MSSAASRGARRPAGWTAAAPPGPAPGARGPPRGASDADHRGPPALPVDGGGGGRAGRAGHGDASRVPASRRRVSLVASGTGRGVRRRQLPGDGRRRPRFQPPLRAAGLTARDARAASHGVVCASRPPGRAGAWQGAHARARKSMVPTCRLGMRCRGDRRWPEVGAAGRQRALAVRYPPVERAVRQPFRRDIGAVAPCLRPRRQAGGRATPRLPLPAAATGRGRPARRDRGEPAGRAGHARRARRSRHAPAPP